MRLQSLGKQVLMRLLTSEQVLMRLLTSEQVLMRLQRFPPKITR